jgi:hypothetical protein
MTVVTTQMQNDWQRRYRASVAESLSGPAIRRSQLRVLARVVAVYVILWGCVGVWTLTAEWGARESIARGEGVAGSFVATRYDSGPGIRGFLVEQWFGEFTVSSLERLRNDLARKALTAIVLVSLFAGIPVAWRWWRRRAFRSASAEPISSW